MICARCGARLQSSDQFCPECGAKVIKERRCPDCGAVLREGTKFCHKCGRLVEGMQPSRKVSEETMDIPIETIERTIVAETEAKVRAERGDKEVIHRKPASRPSQSNHQSNHQSNQMKRPAEPPGKKNTVNEMPPRKKRAVEEMPSRKRKPVYREDEDWDDWDDDEEEEGADVITVLTAVVGCVLLVVVAFLAFNLYRQYVPKDYEKVQEQQLEEQEEQEGQEGQEEEQEIPAEENETISYTLVVVSNVNVRDNPSTEGTNVLKVAKPGESYECYGSVEDGNWYEIRLEDGTTGYVFKDYVTIQE